MVNGGCGGRGRSGGEVVGLLLSMEVDREDDVHRWTSKGKHYGKLNVQYNLQTTNVPKLSPSYYIEFEVYMTLHLIFDRTNYFM